jgi:hypothetical protein
MSPFPAKKISGLCPPRITSHDSRRTTRRSPVTTCLRTSANSAPPRGPVFRCAASGAGRMATIPSVCQRSAGSRPASSRRGGCEAPLSAAGPICGGRLSPPLGRIRPAVWFPFEFRWLARCSLIELPWPGPGLPLPRDSSYLQLFNSSPTVFRGCQRKPSGLMVEAVREMMFFGDRGTHDWASTCSPLGSRISALICFTTHRVGERIAKHSHDAAIAGAARGRIRV